MSNIRSYLLSYKVRSFLEISKIPTSLFQTRKLLFDISIAQLAIMSFKVHHKICNILLQLNKAKMSFKNCKISLNLVERLNSFMNFSWICGKDNIYPFFQPKIYKWIVQLLRGRPISYFLNGRGTSFGVGPPADTFRKYFKIRIIIPLAIDYLR